MSSSDEIQEVFEQDIRKTMQIVYNKYGIQAFLDKEGMQIKDLFDGLVTSEDRDMLQRILDAEVDDDLL